MKRAVCCQAFEGPEREVCIGELTFRPSSYGVLVSADSTKLLMVRIKGKGTLVLPGGGVDLGESTREAAAREFQEETGLEVECIDLLNFSEGYFYYNPTADSWQVFSFVYECRLASGAGDELTAGDPNEGQPEWVKIADLKPETIAPLHRRVISDRFGLGWPL